MAEPRKQLAGEVTDQPTQQLLEQSRADYGKLTPKNFYTVGGKNIPDSRAKQFLANEERICTQVIQNGIDDTHAWAIVRGWRADDPSFIKEDVCTILFSVEYRSIIWNYFAHGCGNPKHKESGCPAQKNMETKSFIVENGAPVLTDPQCVIRAMADFVRIQKFGDRICVTKAEGRIHDKLLRGEWREPEEIETERRDVQDAASGRDVSGGAETGAKEAEKKETTQKKTEQTVEKKAEPAEKKADQATTAAAQAKPSEATQAKQAEVVPGKEEKTPLPPAGATDAAVDNRREMKTSDRVKELARAAHLSDPDIINLVKKCFDVKELAHIEKLKVKAFVCAVEQLQDTNLEQFNKFVRGEADLQIGQLVMSTMEAEYKAMTEKGA
jgi:hypothetical protein